MKPRTMDVIFLFGGCGREIDEGGRPRGSEANRRAPRWLGNERTRSARRSRRLAVSFLVVGHKYHGGPPRRARGPARKSESMLHAGSKRQMQHTRLVHSNGHRRPQLTGGGSGYGCSCGCDTTRGTAARTRRPGRLRAARRTACTAGPPTRRAARRTGCRAARASCARAAPARAPP